MSVTLTPAQRRSGFSESANRIDKKPVISFVDKSFRAWWNGCEISSSENTTGGCRITTYDSGTIEEKSESVLMKTFSIVDSTSRIDVQPTLSRTPDGGGAKGVRLDIVDIRRIEISIISSLTPPSTD